jgi:hypothetical protein
MTKGVIELSERRKAREEGWIILRCAGRATLRLVSSLAEDGYEVWAPIVRERFEVGKLYAKREIDCPMMPGFVFARQGHLIDLLSLSAMPVKPRRGAGRRLAAHPDFGVFHYHDRIPLIADVDLNPLRRLARRRTIAPKAPPLKPYQSVRALEGAGSFQGMVGTVQESNERSTWVCFGRGLLGRVEIPTSFLRPDEVEGLQSATEAVRHKAA